MKTFVVCRAKPSDGLLLPLSLPLLESHDNVLKLDKDEVPRAELQLWKLEKSNEDVTTQWNGFGFQSDFPSHLFLLARRQSCSE